MANVVLFLSDEHNPFISSPYGHRTVRTPNMARLAADGVVFDNAYTPSPLCLPARSAFVSGKRVHEIQCYNNSLVNLRTDFMDYGRALSDQGIHCVHAGKLDVYNDAENLGFSQVLLPSGRKYPGGRNISRRGTPRQDGASRANGFGPKPVQEAYRPASRVIEAAIEWLRTTAPGLDKPWVLSVNIGPPHFPHYTTPELWQRYATAGDLPQFDATVESANHPRARELRQYFETDQFSEEQTRGLRRGYLGCVDWVDAQLGKIRQAVEGAGFSDSTNLIYASDHGEMLGKFGMWWKCSLYEDSARVPCIAAGPDFTTGGRRITTPVDLHDLRAGIFRAVGAEQPSGWLGHALQDIPENDPTRTVFVEYHGHGITASSFLIRRGQWKLIYHCNAPHQLFDLEQDPDEMNNLAGQRPDVVTQMEEELNKICSPEEENRRASEFIQRQVDAIASP